MGSAQSDGQVLSHWWAFISACLGSVGDGTSGTIDGAVPPNCALQGPKVQEELSRDKVQVPQAPQAKYPQWRGPIKAAETSFFGGWQLTKLLAMNLTQSSMLT